MKLSDAHTKMRTDCSSIFKGYDRKLLGQVTRQEFSKIHRELVREKLVKIDLDSCVSILDSKGDGIIYFNDFISWIEKVMDFLNLFFIKVFHNVIILIYFLIGPIYPK